MIQTASPDWELDFYSRPILEPDGKKRWELLICATPDSIQDSPGFRFVSTCPAGSVNSSWLKQALQSALESARSQDLDPPRRLRCWRASMRTMVQRAAEGLGLELIPSRRCYALVEWLQEREREVYPREEGYMAGPLAPGPIPIQPLALPLPEAARGDRWSWATLPIAALKDAVDWPLGFNGLVPIPAGLNDDSPVPGLRLFSASRSLAIAGWLAGLEPVRLEISGRQLVLEAGLEDRWLLASLESPEAEAAAQAFAASIAEAGGLQFIAVQASETASSLDGFWLLRSLPDG